MCTHDKFFTKIKRIKKNLTLNRGASQNSQRYWPLTMYTQLYSFSALFGSMLKCHTRLTIRIHLYPNRKRQRYKKFWQYMK